MTTPVLWFDALDSTNAEARRRAEAGEAGPLWIAARRQSAGRGRRGRAWTTGEGALAATLLITLDLTQAEASAAAFVAALAVHDLAATYVPVSLVALKWPNDLLVAGAKAAGMLVESGPAAVGGVWLAIGFGVNIADAPTGLEAPAAGLGEHLRADQAAPPSPEVALARLDTAFLHWLSVWRGQGMAAVLAAWAERAAGIPGPCVARLPNETLSGMAEGLDSEGRLRLRLGSGEVRSISAGDVFFGEG